MRNSNKRKPEILNRIRPAEIMQPRNENHLFGKRSDLSRNFRKTQAGAPHSAHIIAAASVFHDPFSSPDHKEKDWRTEPVFRNPVHLDEYPSSPSMRYRNSQSRQSQLSLFTSLHDRFPKVSQPNFYREDECVASPISLRHLDTTLVDEWLESEEAQLEPNHSEALQGYWHADNCGQLNHYTTEWSSTINLLKPSIDDGYSGIYSRNFIANTSLSPIQTPIPTKLVRYVPKFNKGALPLSPSSQVSNTTTCNVSLRTVSELPDRFRDFFPFGIFNAVQSQCIDDALYNDFSLIISAPTGSGKTVIMELAMIRLLMINKNTLAQPKMLYIAPTKALCSERTRDWEKKFQHLGIVCGEITGDTDFTNVIAIKKCDIIVTTPEKWDSMTRRWTDNKELMSMIKLFMIDEVHMLREKRGATLEAVVSRMKTMKTQMRYMALSATVPNIKDVATWLGSDAKYMVFGEEYRPVRLIRHVYACQSDQKMNMFMFEQKLNSKLLETIETHSNGKPTLIFCSTRKSTENSCEHLLKQIKDNKKVIPWPMPLAAQSKRIILGHKKLQEYIGYGIAFHHAGLEATDRQIVEKLFTEGVVRVVCTTSTLAVGVNLPAHLVIIKGTQGYANGQYYELSDLNILQMLGRAGRPQFDDSGTAVIMTTPDMKAKYDDLVSGKETLESCLQENLIEHLNSEICLGEIKNVTHAIEWLKSTFLYVRIKENPMHYRQTLSDSAHTQNIDQKLEALCVKDLGLLNKHKMIVMKENSQDFEATECGKAMARYYLKFKTMVGIVEMKNRASLREVFEVLCKAEEYAEFRFQQGEKQVLNELNKNPNIRFPIKGRCTTVDQKISLVIQCLLANIPLNDSKLGSSMTRDGISIINQGFRISKGIIDICSERRDALSLRHSLELYRSMKARTWENSPLILRQIDGIGPAMVRHLITAGITNFERLSRTDARRIEVIVNRHPPFGNQVLTTLASLPRVKMRVQQKAPIDRSTEITLRVTIGLENSKAKTSKNGMGLYTIFWAETSDHVLVDFRRFLISKLSDDKNFSFKVLLSSSSQKVFCHITHENYVGLDVTEEIIPKIDPRVFISIVIPTLPQTDREPESQMTAEKNFFLKDINKENVTEENNIFSDDYTEIDLDEVIPELPPPLDYIGTVRSITTETLPVPSRSASRLSTNLTMANTEIDSIILPSGREMCRHKCKDREKCAHECCKIGKRHSSRKRSSTDVGDFQLDVEKKLKTDQDKTETQYEGCDSSQQATNMEQFNSNITLDECVDTEFEFDFEPENFSDLPDFPDFSLNQEDYNEVDPTTTKCSLSVSPLQANLNLKEWKKIPLINGDTKLEAHLDNINKLNRTNTQMDASIESFEPMIPTNVCAFPAKQNMIVSNSGNDIHRYNNVTKIQAFAPIDSRMDDDLFGWLQSCTILEKDSNKNECKVVEM